MKRLALLLIALIPVVTLAEHDTGANTVSDRATSLTASGELGLPLKATRTIAFKTTEGTQMAVDVSPDGRSLVFDLVGDLYALPVAGGTATRLTHGLAVDRSPRFSPDGQRIAFISDRSGTNNLWVMQRDGSQVRQLTRLQALHMDMPTWCPDGTALAVHVSPDTSDRYRGPEVRDLRRLWRANTRGGPGSWLIPREDYITWGGVFAPDGKSLVLSVKAANSETYSLAVLDLVSDRVTPLSTPATESTLPQISPDGRWIVYVAALPDGTELRLHDRNAEGTPADVSLTRLGYKSELRSYPGGSFTPDSQAFVTSLDGKLLRIDLRTRARRNIPFAADVRAELAPLVRHKRTLVDDEMLTVRRLRSVRSSADGQRLTFSAVGKVWVIDIGGASTRVTSTAMDGGVFEYDPVFSPDGRWIAFVAWSDTEGGAIWKAPAGGGAAVRLSTGKTDFESAYAIPRWTPDGKKLVVLTAAMGPWLRGLDDKTLADVDWYVGQRLNVYQLATVDAEGGAVQQLPLPEIELPMRHRIRPSLSLSADGTHAYVLDAKAVKSFDLSGNGVSAVRVHARLEGDWMRIAVSPDGRQLAVEKAGDVYVMPLPPGGPADNSLPARLYDLRYVRQRLLPPITAMTTEGSTYPDWSADGRSLSWSRGDTYFRLTRPGPDATGQIRPQAIRIVLRVPRPNATGTVVLRGGRIVTMAARGRPPIGQAGVTDPGVIERGDLVVTGRRIVAVGATGTIDVPAGAKVLDVSGTTILPGLIGIHEHFGGGYNPATPDLLPTYETFLARGFTTVLDPGSPGEWVYREELLEAGQVVGPRLFSSVWTMDQETGLASFASQVHARREVRKYAALGSSQLKVYVNIPRLQRQWISIAAAERGMNATNEGLGYHEWLGMLFDGYASVEHEFPAHPLYRDVAELYGRSGTTYTLARGVSMTAIDKMRDVQRTLVAPYDHVPAIQPGIGSGPWQLIEAAIGARDILRAGGNVGVGGHGGMGTRTLGELWMLGIGGMSTAEVLRCATLNGARALGMSDDIGSLEVGKVADLLVLEKNPLDGLEHLADIRYVVRDGFIRDGKTLDVTWPTPKPFLRHPYQRKAGLIVDDDTSSGK